MATTTIGQRFSQLIQQLGLTKNAFAVSLDKTATVIQHLVDERNKPGYDLLCRVFEVYPNVSKDWLLLGRGPMLLNGRSGGAQVASQANKPDDGPFVAELLAEAKQVSAAAADAAPAPAPDTAPPAPEPESEKAAPPAAQSAVSFAAVAVPTEAAAAAVVPVAPPPAPFETYVTAALHTQHLQHQLALAEQRNQHLLEQQKLLQQMLDLHRNRSN